MLSFYSINVYNFLPEVFFSVVILIQIILNLNFRKLNHLKFTSPYSLVVECAIILIFVLLLSLLNNYDLIIGSGLLVTIPNCKYLKVILLFLSILILAPVSKALLLQKINYFEYYTIFLIAILSSLLLISAGDFLSVYLLLEMQALCFYVLIIFKRDSTFAVEAAIHYFIIMALVSCVFLLSLLILYGSLGTLNLFDLETLFIDSLEDSFYSFSIIQWVRLGIFLLVIAVMGKIGLFPYHFWVPKVYEGAPLSTTIVLSYLPKLILFNLFIKISIVFNFEFRPLWFVFLISGLGSVLVGAVSACFQTRLKRLLIYSSISQMGFPILMFTFWAPGTSFIYRGIYLFLLLYLILSIMSWSYYVLTYQLLNNNTDEFAENELAPIYLTNLQSLYSDQKVLSFFSSLTFFSLAGLPPLAGFLAKIYVSNELVTLSICIVVFIILFLGAISTYYYLQIIKIIFFEKSEEKKNYSFVSFQNEFFSDFLFRYCTYVFIFCLFLNVTQFFYIDFWFNLAEILVKNSHNTYF